MKTQQSNHLETPLSDHRLNSIGRLLRNDLAGYVITHDGWVYSLYNDSWLKPSTSSTRYRYFIIRDKGYRADTLVAQGYLIAPNQSIKNYRVCFRDDNPTNPCVENLYVVKKQTEGNLNNSVNGSNFDGRVSFTINEIYEIKKRYVELLNSPYNYGMDDAIKVLREEFSKCPSHNRNQYFKNIVNGDKSFKNTKDMIPYDKLEIGSEVVIDNPKFKNHGRKGTVVSYVGLKDKITLRLQGTNNHIATRAKNLKRSLDVDEIIQKQHERNKDDVPTVSGDKTIEGGDINPNHFETTIKRKERPEETKEKEQPKSFTQMIKDLFTL